MDAPHHRAPLASPASLGWLFVAVGVAAIAGGMASRQAPAEPINGNEALLAAMGSRERIEGRLRAEAKDLLEWEELSHGEPVRSGRIVIPVSPEGLGAVVIERPEPPRAGTMIISGVILLGVGAVLRLFAPPSPPPAA